MAGSGPSRRSGGPRRRSRRRPRCCRARSSCCGGKGSTSKRLRDGVDECYCSEHYMTSQGIVARATSRELSPKERAVADFYAEHREEAAFLSAAEIAERLGTSDATVVRAVKTLGYSGIPELRRELF